MRKAPEFAGTVEASERNIPTEALSFRIYLLSAFTALPRDMLGERPGLQGSPHVMHPQKGICGAEPGARSAPHRRGDTGRESLSRHSPPYCGSISSITFWTLSRIRGRASFLRMFI